MFYGCGLKKIQLTVGKCQNFEEQLIPKIQFSRVSFCDLVFRFSVLIKFCDID